MLNLSSIRVLARAWAAVVLLMVLVMTAFSFNAKAAPNDPPTQLSGGRNQVPGNNTPAISGGGQINNPSAFIENYSQIVREANGPEAQGREAVIRRLEFALEELGRVAVLMGDPKSGKTTVVDQYIRENPQDVVYRLKLGALYELPDKGTQYSAVKSVIRYLEAENANKTDGKVILFVDNLPALNDGHAVETKGSGAILEAIASRRQLPMILETNGATNRDLIMASKAVDERVTRVELPTAKSAELLTYLQQNKQRYQKEFGVNITTDALLEAAKLAEKRFPTRPFDAAESLVRNAARRLQQEQRAGISEAGVRRRQAAALQAALDSLKDDLRTETDSAAKAKLAQQIAETEAKKQELELKSQDLSTTATGPQARKALLEDEAAKLRQALDRPAPQARGGWFGLGGSSLSPADEAALKTRKANEDRLQKITEELLDLKRAETEAKTRPAAPATKVTADLVQTVASEYLGISKAALALDFDEAVKDIPKIGEALLNQDHIIARAAEVIGASRETRAREEAVALKEGKAYRPRPIWSALLAGRTGTGKTEFATQLAKRLGMDVVRIDMTEYSEAHAISRLIGSPPGYVGFDQGGQLTEPVRTQGAKVVLLDEVEKANPVVMRVLYQLLDDGRLTDGQGRTVDFSNTIVLMTTNAGQEYTAMDKAQLIEELKKGGVSLSEADMQKMPEHALRAEAIKRELRAGWAEALVGRIDDVMSTNNHTPAVVARVSNLKAKAFVLESMEFDGIKVVISENAMEALNRSYRPEEGMRSINSAFRRLFTQPLSEMRRQGLAVRGSVVLIDANANGQFDYTAGLPEHLNKARSGEVKGEEAKKAAASRKLKPATGERPAEVKAPAGAKYIHLWNEEYMVRNSTAKAMKRMGKR